MQTRFDDFLLDLVAGPDFEALFRFSPSVAGSRLTCAAAAAAACVRLDTSGVTFARLVDCSVGSVGASWSAALFLGVFRTFFAGPVWELGLLPVCVVRLLGPLRVERDLSESGVGVLGVVILRFGVFSVGF